MGSVHWFDLRVLFCFFPSKITMSYFLFDCLLILHCKKPGLFWRLIVTLKLLCDAAELIWSLRVEPSKNGPQWNLFLREYIGSQVSNFGIMKGDLLVTGHWTGFSYYPVNLFPQITVACYQKQPTFFTPKWIILSAIFVNRKSMWYCHISCYTPIIDTSWHVKTVLNTFATSKLQ